MTKSATTQTDRRRSARRHAQGLRRHPCVHGAGGVAAHLRRDGAAQHRHRAHALPRREIRRLHGRRLRPRVRQAGHLHGAGDRRAQSRRRPARRLARPFAGHRHDRRPRSQDQVPQGLPGDRRRAGLRAGDQDERHHRRRRAHSRHGAPGLPHRHVRRAGAGASAVPRQRRPARSRRGRDGGAGRAAIRPRAAVPPRAAGRARQGRARYPAKSRAADHRRRRRRARFRRRARAGGAGGSACKSRSRPRSTARTRSPACIRFRSAWSAAIRAKAPTAPSTAPIWSASSAPRPAA